MLPDLESEIRINLKGSSLHVVESQDLRLRQKSRDLVSVQWLTPKPEFPNSITRMGFSGPELFQGVLHFHTRIATFFYHKALF